MAQTIRVILYTANESAAPELRRAITSLPHLRVVAELDEPSLLGQAVSQFPADVLIADLDPNPPLVLECIRQLKDSSDIPVFALSKQSQGDVVLKALRAGVKEYLLKPINSEELSQALGRVSGIATKTRQPGKLISMLGSCGGVGCTTLAVNLAVELADLAEGQMVAIVDLDFRFGHVATLLDVHGQHTIADLCSTQEQLDSQVVKKALIKHESGVYVLRRPHHFSQAELITSAHCANVLASLQEMCAYVVVDGPTRQDVGGRNVLDAADYNFMVLQLLVTSVRNADRMVQELSVQGFNTDRLSFVCNRLGRESSHLAVSQVEAILNRPMFAVITDDWKSVSSSINIGRPLKLEYEKSRVRHDIRQLAMKVHSPATQQDTANRGGLFGKFFGKPATSGKSESSMSAGASPIPQG